MQGKNNIKKIRKEQDLFEAAFKLFTSKGFKNTAIDDIVKSAGVAKGTFYLYFKDKYDIANKLVLTYSSKMMKNALEKTKMRSYNNFDDLFLYFVDCIIDDFKGNTTILKMINKNFSWGMFRKEIMKPEQYEEMREILELFINHLKEKGTNNKEAEYTLFMVIELIGSVCYSTLILNEPCSLDEIKPVLFKKIKNMID